MDRASVFSLSVLAPEYGEAEDSRATIQSLLAEFVLTFRLGNMYIYRFETAMLEQIHIHQKAKLCLQRSASRECPD